MRMGRIVLWRMKKHRDKRLSWCQVPVPAPTLWKTQVDELLNARRGLEPVLPGQSIATGSAPPGFTAELPGMLGASGGKRRIPAPGLSESVALCHRLGDRARSCGSRPGGLGPGSVSVFEPGRVSPVCPVLGGAAATLHLMAAGRTRQEEQEEQLAGAAGDGGKEATSQLLLPGRIPGVLLQPAGCGKSHRGDSHRPGGEVTTSIISAGKWDSHRPWDDGLLGTRRWDRAPQLRAGAAPHPALPGDYGFILSDHTTKPGQ